MIYDVIVVGAGAAGLMFSNFIDKDFKTLIVEKNDKPGRKLMITGGGRCNLTNNKEVKEFLENVEYNHKYLYSALTRFGPKDIMNYINIPLKEEKDNQIFPKSDKAGDVLNYLLNNKKCNINSSETVSDITKIDDVFNVVTTKGEYKSHKIVIATGGCSYPHLGSSGDHLKFAENFNQEVTPVFPAETSILVNNLDYLAGTAFDKVEIKLNKKIYTGNLIFTHTGLSGTSIMKISEHVYLNNIKEIIIDYVPKVDVLKYLEDNKDKNITNVLNKLFTKKFSSYLLTKVNINQELNIKSINKKDILNLVNIIKEDKINISGVTDIAKAYVTGGGISLKQIDIKTFESKTVKNMYYIGEALDIHGPIGGYNLTLAFSTAYNCAKAINETKDYFCN